MNLETNKYLNCTQKLHNLYKNQILQTTSNSTTKPCCVACQRLWDTLANLNKILYKSPSNTFIVDVPVLENNQFNKDFISNELDYYDLMQYLKNNTELAIICESFEECEYIRSLPQQYIFNIDDWSSQNLMRWPFFDRENIAFFYQSKDRSPLDDNGNLNYSSFLHWKIGQLTPVTKPLNVKLDQYQILLLAINSNSFSNNKSNWISEFKKIFI